MNDQNFGERVNISGIIEQTDQDAKSPVVINSDSLADPVVPVDATFAPDVPLDGSTVDVEPADEILIHKEPISMDVGSAAALFSIEESEHFRTRWSEIQGRFVDEPRSAVQQADALVSEVIEKITRMFADEHSLLERQWNQGNDVSTEDFRKALQHYRTFFNRLILKNEE